MDFKRIEGNDTFFCQLSPYFATAVSPQRNGSVEGNIAGQVATTALVSTGNLSGNVKNEDELTLDLKLQSTIDNSLPLARKFKYGKLPCRVYRWDRRPPRVSGAVTV